jgi:Uma2 family endonuclease
MEATLPLPLTLSARLDLPVALRVTASWEEFLELLPDCNYRIEYDQGQIISFTGYATENHETLVLKIAELLRHLLGEEQYNYRGSNLALHVPDEQKHYFNADCTVIQGKSEKVPLRGSMYAIANPILLVEVLSATTSAYDLSHKFTAYRKIPTLQQVLFIDSERANVISQTRVKDGDAWLLREYQEMEAEINVLDQGSFRLTDLYAKIDFTPDEPQA